MKKIAFYSVIALAIVAGGISYYGASLNTPVAATPAAPVAAVPQAAAVISSGTIQVAPVAANAAAVGVAASLKVSWNTSDYPSQKVSITLISKTGDKPARYENVRMLSASTANTGSYSWTPTASEVGQTLLVQIGCVNSTAACQARMIQI